MKRSSASSSGAFTIIELLVYTAIFTVVMIAFISIFVTLSRVQSNQSASVEVEQQSEFLLQQIQYYVEASSLVEIPTDTATTTLKLRMPNPAIDPTYITVSNGTMYIQQTATGTLQALSSS